MVCYCSDQVFFHQLATKVAVASVVKLYIAAKSASVFTSAYSMVWLLYRDCEVPKAARLIGSFYAS